MSVLKVCNRDRRVSAHFKMNDFVNSSYIFLRNTIRCWIANEHWFARCNIDAFDMEWNDEFGNCIQIFDDKSLRLFWNFRHFNPQQTHRTIFIKFIADQQRAVAINDYVQDLIAMGFSNEGNWLTLLLDHCDGDMTQTLEVLQYFR